MPQELRLAGIATADGANEFLNTRYVAEFNGKSTMEAKEQATAFSKTSRRDLDWIFSVRNERVVAKGNTVTMVDRVGQIGKTAFKNTLAKRIFDWGHGKENPKAGSPLHRPRLQQQGRKTDRSRVNKSEQPNLLATIDYQSAPDLGIVSVCDALGVSRACLHRRQNSPPLAEVRLRPSPAQSLTSGERVAGLRHLHAERFQDRSLPAEVCRNPRTTASRNGRNSS